MIRFAVPFLALALIGTARADLSYPDFSSTSGLTTNGDTTVVNNQLQLTDTIAGQAGSVFTTSQVSLGSDASFSTQFQFKITDPGGPDPDPDGTAAGGDGLVFVLQTDKNTALGTNGRGMGYGGIKPSLGIEFDTYQNTDVNDPDGNHVGIDTNGNLTSLKTASEATAFNNGSIWNAWITYDGSTGSLDVYYSMSDTRPKTADLSTMLNLTSILGQDTCYAGFTAATGTDWENHDILNWQFAAVVPEPSSLLMFGIGIVGVVWKLGRQPRVKRGLYSDSRSDDPRRVGLALPSPVRSAGPALPDGRGT